MDDTEAAKSEFLQQVGKWSGELEEIFLKNEVVSSETLNAMESSLGTLLFQGFFSMDRQVLSPQEYYQGCMAMLLGRLSQQVGPQSVVASLQSRLKLDNNSDNKNLLLNLVLDRSRGSQRNPGLQMEDWSHALDLVSTLQSNVAVVNRRLEQRKKWLQSSKQQRHLLSKGTPEISKDSLEAMWVVPLSYMIGHVVYDITCKSQDGETNAISWERDIRPKVDTILSDTFPQLRPIEFIDAGFTLLQLDLLQEDQEDAKCKVLVEDLNTGSIANKLHGGLLKLLMLTTDLPRYTLLARCAQIFLSRLDIDSIDEIVSACTRLFRQESAVQYMEGLEKEKSSALPNLGNGMLLTNGNGKTKDEASQRDKISSLGFPLLTNIDTLLVDDNVEHAIDIAVRMEQCPALTEEDQLQAWGTIVHYLFQTGHIFLDGFPVRRPQYMANRKFILENIMNRAGSTGLTIFIQAYETVLERVAKLPDVTDEEHEYIQRACHQTVLRILQAKYGETQGIVEFQQTYWKNVETIIASCRFHLPSLLSLSVSSSQDEQQKWSFDLLVQPNEVPDSLRLDDTRRPDLVQLFRRGEPEIERELVAAGSATKTPAAVKEAIGAVVLDESSPATASEIMENDDEEREGVLLVGTAPEIQEIPPSHAHGDATNANDKEDAHAIVVDDDEEVEEDAAEAEEEESAVEAVEEIDDMEVEQLAAPGHEGEYDEVVILDDSEEEGCVDTILPRNKVGDGHESDETADEESAQELLGGNEIDHEAEVADSDGEYAAQQEARDSEEGEHDAHLGEEDDAAHQSDDEVIEVLDDNEDNEEAEEAERDGNEEGSRGEDIEEVEETEREGNEEGSHGEIIDTTSQTGYGSQTGYEPEDTHGFTEEEVSEAMHTEDEDEERQEAPKVSQTTKDAEERKEEVLAPIKPHVPMESHTLSDMDAADEHTTEHEEDLGAESSELDEGDGTDAPPYSDARSPSDKTGQGTTLMDFARRAQSQVEPERSTTPTRDPMTGSSTGARPWHWSGVSSPKRDDSMDPQETKAGENSAASHEAVDPEDEAPQQHSEAHALETPVSAYRQQSVMGASFADTSAAQFGSVSFVDSPNYAPTDDDEDKSSPQKKVLVDCVPEVFEHSPDKARKPFEEGADEIEQIDEAGDSNVPAPAKKEFDSMQEVGGANEEHDDLELKPVAVSTEHITAEGQEGPEVVEHNKDSGGATEEVEESDVDPAKDGETNLETTEVDKAGQTEEFFETAEEDKEEAEVDSLKPSAEPERKDDKAEIVDEEVETDKAWKTEVFFETAEEEKEEVDSVKPSAEPKWTDARAETIDESIEDALREDTTAHEAGEPTINADAQEADEIEMEAKPSDDFFDAEMEGPEEYADAKMEGPEEYTDAKMEDTGGSLDPVETSTAEQLDSRRNKMEAEGEAKVDETGDPATQGAGAETEDTNEAVPDAETTAHVVEIQAEEASKIEPSGETMDDGEAEAAVAEAGTKVLDGSKAQDNVEEEAVAIEEEEPEGYKAQETVEEEANDDAEEIDTIENEEPEGHKVPETMEEEANKEAEDTDVIEVEEPEGHKAQETLEEDANDDGEEIDAIEVEEPEGHKVQETAEEANEEAEDAATIEVEEPEGHKVQETLEEDSNGDGEEIEPAEPEGSRETVEPMEDTADAEGVEGVEQGVSKENNDSSPAKDSFHERAGVDHDEENAEEVEDIDDTRNEATCSDEDKATELATQAAPSTPGTVGTPGGKSINIPENYDALSPAMSSVAASDDGSSMRSPPKLPIASKPAETPNVDEELEEEAPKTAKRTNRRRAKKEEPKPRAMTRRKRVLEASNEESDSAIKKSKQLDDENEEESEVVAVHVEPASSAMAAENTNMKDDQNDEVNLADDAGSIESKKSSLPTTVHEGRKRTNSVSDIEHEEEESDQMEVEESKETKRSTRGRGRPPASSPAASTTSIASRRSKRAGAGRNRKYEGLEEPKIEDEPVPTSRSRKTKATVPKDETPRRTRRGTRAKKAEDSSDAKDKARDDDDESSVASQGARRSGRRQASRSKASSASESDADDQSVASGVSARRSTRRRVRPGSVSDAQEPKETKSTQEEQKAEVEEDFDEVSTVSVRSKGSKGAKIRAKKQKLISEDDELAPIPEESALASPELKAPPKRTTRAKRGRKASEDSEADTDQDEEVKPTSQRTTRSRRKKTATEDGDAGSIASSSKEEDAKPKGKATGSKRGKAAETDDEEESVASVAEEKAKPKGRATRSKRGKAAATDDEESVASVVEEKAKPKGRATRSKRGKNAASDDEESVVSAAEEKAKPKGRATRSKRGKAAATDDEESVVSVVEEKAKDPAKTTRRATRSKRATVSATEEAANNADDNVSVAESETEVIKPKKASRSRAQASAKTRKAKKAGASSDDDSAEEEEETKPKAKTTRKATGGAKRKADESTDDDEVSTASSVRRSGRNTKGRRTYKV